MATVASLIIGVTADTAQAEARLKNMKSSIAGVRAGSADFLGKIGSKFVQLGGLLTLIRGVQDFTSAMAKSRVEGETWTKSLATGIEGVIEKGGLLGKVIESLSYFRLPQMPGGLGRGTFSGDLLAAFRGGSAAGGGSGLSPGRFRQVTRTTAGLGGLETTQAAKQTALLQQIAANTKTVKVQ